MAEQHPLLAKAVALAQAAQRADAAAPPGSPAYSRPASLNSLATIWRVSITYQLAALLGINPAHLHERADTDRAYLGLAGVILTVATTDLHFIPLLGLHGAFALLGDCPRCGAEDVPVAAITSLVDLGHWVLTGAQPPDAELCAALRADLGHAEGCAYPDAYPDRQPWPDLTPPPPDSS